MIDWILKNYIEVIGSVLGLVYVYLSIRQKIALWMVGILTSAFFIVVFYASKLYANMSLQGYYLLMSMYGWYVWKKASVDSDHELAVKKTPLLPIIACLFSGILVMIVIFYLLKNYTDSPFPILDSFTTSLSIIATWMLTRKYIENWLLWILVDSISVGLYLFMKLYPTAILFLVYTVMAFVGYITWKKSLLDKNPVY